MEILMLTKAYPPWIGGVETHVKQLAEALASRGHRITVLACSPNGRKEIISARNLEVILVPRLATVRSMPFSLTYPLCLRKFSPDIIHIHHPHPLGFISALLFRPKAPVVVTWHSDIIRQKRLLQLFKPFQDCLLRKSGKIISTSPNLMQNSPHLRPFLEKCLSVPLGIDLGGFDQRMKHETARGIIRNLSTDRPNLLFVGRLVEYKGLVYLLRAMRDIDAKLHVVGTGPMLDGYQEMVCELDITEKVVFHGQVSDEELAGYYGGCDVFVLPSISNNEAFGIVQLEAMAAGKPVVSTDLPTGVPFVNQHNRTGLIVSPKDPNALSTAIKALLNDSETCKNMGLAARRRVEEEFSIEHMVDGVVRIYESLCGK